MEALVAPLSFGDLIDRITILEIKSSRIAVPAKRANVIRELASLNLVLDGLESAPGEVAELRGALRQVNEHLWDAEETVRSCESRGDFGEGFVAAARSIYLTNDRRAFLKRQLNRLFGSHIVEEKSFELEPGVEH